MLGLLPHTLILVVTVAVEPVGDREHCIVLHVPAVCGDVESGPRDPAFLLDRCRRQREGLRHVFITPVRCRVNIEPEVAGHRAGLRRLNREATYPFVG